MTADGAGVVSHAGAELLRELAAATGLVDGWGKVLVPTYKPLPSHFPGQVLADLALAVADGATSISDLKALRGQPGLFGPVASMPTAWRVLDRVNEAHLPGITACARQGKAEGLDARRRPRPLQRARHRHRRHERPGRVRQGKCRPTSKKTFGHHPLRSFLPRTEVSSGEAMADLVRPANAGSNTATAHIEVLDMSLASLPEEPRPKTDGGPEVLVRSDIAWATHDFAAHCRARYCDFSLGFAVGEAVRPGITKVPEEAWYRAVEQDGEPRDGAFVAEVTNLLYLSAWPEGSRSSCGMSAPTQVPSSASSSNKTAGATPPHLRPPSR